MMSVRLSISLALALTLAAGPAAAQAPAAPPAPPAPPVVKPIPYSSVNAALAALKARDGQDTVVTTSDGWVVVAEPSASTQWAFPPAGHAAHPAVVRRTIVRTPGSSDVSVDVSLLCEAPAAACEALRAEYASMNDRIIQAAKARRTRPTPPPAPN